ncbi:12-oxophytodienoate reductase [Exophiala viscosa]|uniref:12-oxophytodienoate reductase n=1 Tax=Exophiala viscosa TaxID=2486360 RepID=A0AAN6DV15_9EURO|nr:12-oxophytodienoate reductase [Exophiala viscosa]
MEHLSQDADSTPDSLALPFPLSSLHTLSHRMVLAPMTRMRASDDGIINTSAAEYYSSRATPGGLLISEGVVVAPRGRGFPNTPGLYTPEQVAAWKVVTEAVHDKGGVFFAQIWHVGRVAVPSQTGGYAPLSSTAGPLPGAHQLFGQQNATELYVPGEAMTKGQIEEAVGQFAQAARNAIEAGFDGVEIHGGNGYLLDTFVHSNINDRTDEYGGSLDNRLRFPLEVVDAVVEAVGSKRVGIRLAPFHVLQETLDEDRMGTFSEYARWLSTRGLAYVHLVEPRYDVLSTEGAFAGKVDRKAGAAEEVATSTTFSLEPFREILNKTNPPTPLIGAGGYSASSAREAVKSGRVDLVAIGRHFTSNPDLVDRLLLGKSLTKYDRPTFYTPTLEGYLGWKTWKEEENPPRK